MKDAKNRDSTESFPFTSRTLSEKLKQIKASPSLLLANVSLFALGFLFSRCHVIFGARPLAIGLLALLPYGIFPTMVGAVIGALSLGAGGTVYAIIYTLTVALRMMTSGSSGDEKAFGENLLMRICEATISGFILAVYQIVFAGFGAASILFGLTVTVIPPVICFALSGVFDSGMTFGEFFGSGTELLSFDGRPEHERYALIFFHMSAALLSLLISLSLSEFQLFGFSFAYVYASVVTLFIAHRYGAARGAVAGFVSVIPLSATNAASFALAGAASGLLFSLGGLLGVGAGAVLLCAWCAYTGGIMGVLTTLPEYALGAAITLPFVNKTLQKPLQSEAKSSSGNAGEMVCAMTLAYKSKASPHLDSLEEALVGISSAARGFEVGATLREDDLRSMVLSCIRTYGGEKCEAARELCIEKSAVIASRLKTGREFSTAMFGLCDNEATAEELCELISRRAAAMEEERYRQSLTADRYEDYRLISKLLNEARADLERERAVDPDLSDRLSLLFAECGFPDGIIKVFGERYRHIIAAGEDPSGDLITSPELRSGIEKLLDVRLGEAEYFRRGTTVLMEVGTKPQFSAKCECATIQGSSGEVSGDVCTHFSSEDGYFYTLLSDGMGSGELARETAQFVTKFLSYTLRSGGFRDTVLELLNNIVRRRGEECSATVDLFSLDLIRGDAVFIKSGAAPSYLKRDSSVFRVRSETAPIGLMTYVDTERMRVEVRPGDYVIMLSDGVSSTPEDAPWLLELLAEPPRSNLKEYAEYLLAEAVKHSSTGDDMTVMIARIEDAST